MQTSTYQQEDHYYPYGGLMGESTGGDVQCYKYNGKELNRMHGLDWYDYGARHYDAAIGSWPTMDPLAEKYYSISPYAYCGDNPIKFVDIEGKAVYLFATTLPGADWVPFATHTFLVVTNTDGSLRGYYSFGSEQNGIRGVFGGQLTRTFYQQDLDIINGNDTENLKRKILIPVPDGMASEEFDQTVINVANSYGNNTNIRYCINPIDELTGNCNSSTSTILLKSGVSSNQIREIKKEIPGISWGFDTEEKAWTKEEQQEIVEKNLNEYDIDIDRIHFMMRGH